MTKKVCFVNAAGQGIGRAIAIGLHEAGHEVIATDLDEKLLEDLKADSGITTAPLDVTSHANILALASHLERTELLYHCAGFVHAGSVLDVTDEDYDFSFDLNVRSAFRMSRAVLPGMLARGSGALTFISSVASSIKGVPNRAVYGASKAALIGLSKSIAADFVRHGIRSNCICPGTVETPSLSQRIQQSGSDLETQRRAFIERQPMGRFGTPNEIAALAVFLANPGAGFITGQALAIDGGWTI